MLSQNAQITQLLLNLKLDNIFDFLEKREQINQLYEALEDTGFKSDFHETIRRLNNLNLNDASHRDNNQTLREAMKILGFCGLFLCVPLGNTPFMTAHFTEYLIAEYSLLVGAACLPVHSRSSAAEGLAEIQSYFLYEANLNDAHRTKTKLFTTAPALTNMGSTTPVDFELIEMAHVALQTGRESPTSKKDT